jgi:hypothetical protein
MPLTTPIELFWLFLDALIVGFGFTLGCAIAQGLLSLVRR